MPLDELHVWVFVCDYCGERFEAHAAINLPEGWVEVVHFGVEDMGSGYERYNPLDLRRAYLHTPSCLKGWALQKLPHVQSQAARSANIVARQFGV